MQTIDEAREHCRFVGKGIEKAVADGGKLAVIRTGFATLQKKVYAA